MHCRFAIVVALLLACALQVHALVLRPFLPLPARHNITLPVAALLPAKKLTRHSRIRLQKDLFKRYHKASTPGKISYIGVNEAGLEFGKGAGVAGTDYFPPKSSSYFAQQGMNVIRLPFAWERAVQTPGGPLVGDYVQHITDAVTEMKGLGLYVILDLHNYARFNDQLMGSGGPSAADLANIWLQIMQPYKNDPQIVIGLMNEPHGIDALAWVAIAQTVIASLRAEDIQNLIIVPGTQWTGGHSWNQQGYGTPNGDAMKVFSGQSNIAMDIHQYMDADSSGTSDDCVSATAMRDNLADVTKWLRDNSLQGWLTETAVGPTDTCLACLKDGLAFLTENSDVWAAMTWWAAGAQWGNYRYSVEPPAPASAQSDLLLSFVQSQQPAKYSSQSGTPSAPAEPAPSSPSTPAEQTPSVPSIPPVNVPEVVQDVVAQVPSDVLPDSLHDKFTKCNEQAKQCWSDTVTQCFANSNQCQDVLDKCQGLQKECNAIWN